MLIRSIPLFLLGIVSVVSLGQDPSGEAVLKKLKIPPAPVLAPSDAIKSFKIAPGFRVELVASEPLVADPVAISFDADGRIYVCEMRGYMPTIDGKGERDPVGRIVVLEDVDGDGLMDKSHLYLDKLVLPRAVCWTPRGVLVAENNKLWLCTDKNGDLKCDDRAYICDYGAGGNPEYGGNGLMPGLDNWIYNAAQGIRLRRTKDGWAREGTIGRGQWGITQDDAGRLYYNSNSSLLRGDLVGSYSPAAHAAGPLTNVGLYKEQDVWPARVTPGVNRGYYNLRPDGTLKSVTAACGPCIFRGDNLPADVRGDAFICEPAANLVRRNLFIDEKGKRTTKNAYDKAEFLASTDERFRPVNLMNGPDGTLYIVDLYRGILQHRTYMTPFLRKQVVERGLDAPIGLGRIYRVVHESSVAKKQRGMSTMNPAELLASLSDANGWRRDMAQRLLVDRGDKKVIPALVDLATEGKSSLGRLHALWTLEGMGVVDTDTLASLASDKDSAVRASAVNLSRRWLREPPNPDLLRELTALGDDPSLDVRLELVFALGLMNHPKADQALEPTLKAAANEPGLLDAILAGFAGRETEFLAARFAQPGWSKAEPWREKLITAAARYVWKQRHPLAVLRFAHLVGAQSTDQLWRQRRLLEGLASASAKSPSAKVKPKPLSLPTAPESIERLRTSDDAKLAKAANLLAEHLNWPGKDGKPLPLPPPLSAEHQVLYEQGRKEFVAHCAACHHPAGYGESGKGPPLLDSDWLEGSPERLVRMVLQGVRGPIAINKEVFNRDSVLDMPALAGALDDQKIAAVLTFVRREWGDFAAPVDRAVVTRIRAATKNRFDQWTEPELLKIK